MNQHIKEMTQWASDPVLIQRARTMLVVSLSKRKTDELVRILMDWLTDDDLQAFCGRYMEPSDVKWIRR